MLLEIKLDKLSCRGKIAAWKLQLKVEGKLLTLLQIFCSALWFLSCVLPLSCHSYLCRLSGSCSCHWILVYKEDVMIRLIIGRWMNLSDLAIWVCYCGVTKYIVSPENHNPCIWDSGIIYVLSLSPNPHPLRSTKPETLPGAGWPFDDISPPHCAFPPAQSTWLCNWFCFSNYWPWCFVVCIVSGIISLTWEEYSRTTRWFCVLSKMEDLESTAWQKWDVVLSSKFGGNLSSCMQ